MTSPSPSPTCDFCPATASVSYRYGAGVETHYCGGHAQEILHELPAEMFAALERAA